MDNNYKWIEEYFNWGIIGRLKNEYREGYKLQDIEEGYWPFGIFIEDNEEKTKEYKLEKIEIYKNLAKTKNFELKYWTFKKGGQDEHKPKIQRNALEYNFILEGSIRGRVDNTKDIFLNAGDYTIIKPGFVVNLEQEILEDTKGITIKVPSIENDAIKKDRFDNF